MHKRICHILNELSRLPFCGGLYQDFEFKGYQIGHELKCPRCEVSMRQVGKDEHGLVYRKVG